MWPSTPTNIRELPVVLRQIREQPFHMGTAMLAKGNVLQYRANNASMTKHQKYAQIARRHSAERRTVFASQTQTVTAPNSSMIGRIQAVITAHAASTLKRPRSKIRDKVTEGCFESRIPVGGILIANTHANECTGTIFNTPTQLGNYPCASSTFSGITKSGDTRTLCWAQDIPTWIPKGNHSVMVVMANRNAFDADAVNVVVPIPQITGAKANAGSTTATVVWTINRMQAYIYSYVIYVNGVLAGTFMNDDTYTAQISAAVNDTVAMEAVVRLTTAAVQYSGMSNTVSVSEYDNTTHGET